MRLYFIVDIKMTKLSEISEGGGLMLSEQLMVALRGEPKESKGPREEQKLMQETLLRNKAQEGLRLIILPPCPPGQHLA